MRVLPTPIGGKSRRADRAPTELANRAAGGADDHRPAGVEVGPETGHGGVEDQAAVARQPPEDGSVGHRAVQMAAAKEASTHAGTSDW